MPIRQGSESGPGHGIVGLLHYTTGTYRHVLAFGFFNYFLQALKCLFVVCLDS
jgi:hypothetical protein